MTQLSLKQLVPPPAENTTTPPVTLLPPPPTSLSQLLNALEGVLKMARDTRDRESELLERATLAQAEAERHEADAAHWRNLYESLDKKIPWWARKLLGL
jgi:hypothetical protein